MLIDKIDIAQKFSLFAEHWQPKIVASLNGQEVKLAKVKGQFPWHTHDKEDELFLVWKGQFRVEFRDQVINLGPGQAMVVPRGVEHRTAADQEAEIIIFESAGTVNTGNVQDEFFTAKNGIQI